MIPRWLASRRDPSKIAPRVFGMIMFLSSVTFVFCDRWVPAWFFALLILPFAAEHGRDDI